jgi:hypothetical protein
VAQFDIRHGDEWIRVSIIEGFATIHVLDIDDIRIVIEALKKATAAGATRGTMFTGCMVEDHSAAMHTMRSEKGITWLGGKVTVLSESPSPMFRIDWDILPTITE